MFVKSEAFSEHRCVSYGGACVAVAMLVAEVPQVNGQLVELVVPQVSMGQQAAE